MSTKPYILTASDYSPESKRFFNSMKEVLGDSVRSLHLMYGPHDGLELGPTATIVKYQHNFPGNTARLLDFHKVLPMMDVDQDAWFIFTDVHDVIFQKLLPDLDEVKADVIFCSEGKDFGQIDFWQQRYPLSIHRWEAVNTGCFAMRYSALKEFLEEVNKAWNEFGEWFRKDESTTVPRSPKEVFPQSVPFIRQLQREAAANLFNNVADTYIYNLFLRNTAHSVTELPTLFTTYAFNYELGNIVIRDGKTYTKNGELISIVHYNGSMKKHMEACD